MLVRDAPLAFGTTVPSMIIGMLTTIVSTFVIFIGETLWSAGFAFSSLCGLLSPAGC
jgi:hypothetical protein